MQRPATLIQCLKNGLSHPESKAVNKDNDAEIYNIAKEPYNTRLAPSVSPMAITFVNTPDEIINVIACAREYNVPIAPRSGGHSYGAYSLGGALGGIESPNRPRPGEPSIILDLRGIRGIAYDSGSKTVKVGPGAMLGELINSLSDNGMMTPTGTCPTVGVGGQALSGGFGLYSRQYGSLAEQIVGMEVILADGQSVRVSESERPDLFFALRGGGTAFAIVHSFTFKTYPVPPSVYYYELTMLPRALPSNNITASRAANYFMAYQEFAQSSEAPNKMSMLWHVTPEKDGAAWGTKVEVLGQFAGTEAEYNTAMNALKRTASKYGENDLQTSTRPYSFIDAARNNGGDWSQLAQRGPYNLNEHIHFYARSFITRVDYALDTITNHMRDVLALSATFNPDTGADWFTISPYLGGNSAVKDSTGAFGFRDIKMLEEHYAKRLFGSVDTVDLVNRMVRSLGPPKAAYPAYVDTEIPAGAFPRLLYGDLYKRLQDIKAAFDVSNMFRQPQTVKAGDYQETSYMSKRARRSLRAEAAASRPFQPPLEEDGVLSPEIDWPRPSKRIVGKSRQPNMRGPDGFHFLLILVVALGIWYALRRRRAALRRSKDC